jgi:PAS domain-containing protein
MRRSRSTARSTAGSAIADRLGAVLDAVDDGITVQDPSGRLVYSNLRAVQLIGFESPDELLAADPADIIARFELFDESGAPLPIDALPGRQALAGVAVPAAPAGARGRAPPPPLAGGGGGAPPPPPPPPPPPL